MARALAVRIARPLARPLALIPSRRLTIRLLAALAALALLAGAWTWLRQSPLVAVEHVRISGVHGTDAAAIESALRSTARHMSTMDTHAGALMAAVAPYRVVREVRLSSSFPHGLRIQVIEQPPVAALTMGTAKTAVAADGVVLGPSFLSSSLPVIHTALPAPGAEHVSGASLLAELTILGAAPETLIGWISRVFTARNGITVAMRNGLRLYFGDAERPHAKWLSAARVLSDPTAAGASYIDVRLPERPAAGMGAGGESAAGAPAGAAQVSASDPTAAALAATLESAVNGGSSATGSTGSGGSGAGTSTTAETATSESAAPESASAGAASTAVEAPGEAANSPAGGG
jgi:cell division protein FtsQ